MVTLTFNLLNIVRFVAIIAWAVIAGVVGFGMIWIGSREDTYVGHGIILLCLLSIIALWFAGHP